MATDVRTAAAARATTKTASFGGLRRVLALWAAVASERRHLRDLSDRDLRDLGLTRDDVVREAGRAFWDTPQGR